MLYFKMKKGDYNLMVEIIAVGRLQVSCLVVNRRVQQGRTCTPVSVRSHKVMSWFHVRHVCAVVKVTCGLFSFKKIVFVLK